MSRSLVFAEWKLGTDFHWCPIENKKIKNKNCIFFINFRVHSITIPIFGATEVLITSQEERLALTYKRQSYLHTGPHPSPRSVSVWRSTISSDSLSSTSKPTLSTPLSLMGNTATPHWVVTCGSRWLARRPPCNLTAIGKDSMRWETTLVYLKQESASLLTRRVTVVPVTLTLVLAQEVHKMTPTRVEMRQRIRQIMETSTLKPWGTSSYNDRIKVNFPKF